MLETTRYLALLVGSQNLYGPDVLNKVATNGEFMSGALSAALMERKVPLEIHLIAPIMTSPDLIEHAFRDAAADPNCAGIIVWCHTFSPGLMWQKALANNKLPLLHLMTQFIEDLPYDTINMDHMNTHQSAHGDLEWGHGCVEAGQDPRIIVGHWTDQRVQDELACWARAALGWRKSQGMNIAWYDGTMNNVAVTRKYQPLFEEITGAHVLTCSTMELMPLPDEKSVPSLVREYLESYEFVERDRKTDLLVLRDAARIEFAFRQHLHKLEAGAFTYNFELMAFPQLPGLTAQRAMADGLGFGPEGDYGTAWLVAMAKAMGVGLPGGASLAEQYTYDLTPGHQRLLYSHMLEICPSLTSAKPKLEIHPLSIGGKEDPPRLVFDADPGQAVIASLVQIRGRLRMIVAKVEIVVEKAMPNLPVARILGKPLPDFHTGVWAWRRAAGAHHEVITTQLTVDHFTDLARILGIECLVIDENTNMRQFEANLRLGEVYYGRR